MNASAPIAFAVTAVLAPITVLAMRRYRVIDHPSYRSSHSIPVPRGLGVALVVGALVALPLVPRLEGFPVLGLAVPTAAFGVLGLVEDVIGVPPRLRLLLQSVIAVGALPFLVGGFTGSPLWLAAFCLGVAVWLVGFVNSFNFMDGINGISAAQTFVAGASFVIIGQAVGFESLAAGGAIAIGVAVGFAPVNFPRALGFLGDVGSYFIGAWIAVLVIIGLRAGVPFEAMVGSLAIYLADTATTFIRRWRRGDDLWAPHKSHVYQRLPTYGWSFELTTAYAAGAMLLCGFLGSLSLVGSARLRVFADVLVFCVLVIYVTTPRRLQRRQERRDASRLRDTGSESQTSLRP